MCASEVSPRRSRVIRVLRVMVICAVALAALDGVLTVAFGRRYWYEIDQIRQRGEPVSMSDIRKLAGDPVPDSENAALAYKRIFKRMDELSHLKLLDDLSVIFPDTASGQGGKHTPEVWAAAEAAASQLEPIVRDAEKAGAMPKCLFPVNWEDGAGALFPHYASLRNLSRLLIGESMVYAHRGQMDKAVHCSELVIGVSERVKRDPTLVGSLVRVAVVNMASRSARAYATASPIDETQAKRLYDAFGTVDLSAQSRLAWLGERAFSIWLFDWMLRHPKSAEEMLGSDTKPPGLWYSLAGFKYADAACCLRCETRQLDSAMVPFRQAYGGFEDIDNDVKKLPFYARFTKLVVPVFSRCRAARDQCQAEVDITRAALAIIAYKDRFGSYPASLDDVTKKLGWKLPLDIFSGKDLVYKPRANGFTLYSIGPNLKDDGGAPPGKNKDIAKDGDVVVSRSM